MKDMHLQRAQEWLQAPYDSETQAAVKALIKEGGEALIEAFYKDLDFGTGGLRGIMGVGTNRVNAYTLGIATQGLSNYLHRQYPSEDIKVAIAYDCRHNSQRYARKVAEVLAANNITAYLFDELRPTPSLSFAVRALQCQSGIVLTASHNPPEYNGYKVYWNDGGQLVPPHDKGVIAEVRAVEAQAVRYDFDPAKIISIEPSVDRAYLDSLKALSLTREGKDQLSVVFSAIHGTSITMMPQAFADAGFVHFHNLESQAEPDGDFPTVQSPNPEEAEALSLALAKAEELGADMVIGTDPDGDRVGIAVRNLAGNMELLNGNQAASVLIYYLLEQWQKAGRLSGKQFVAKTIVTTDLISEMAAAYGLACPECLTGFKWIADLIRAREGQMEFIGGGEESYGYLVGDAVRDKDAIGSAVMLAEAAAFAKAQGRSFYELLVEVYQRFGFFLEKLVSLKKEGRQGQAEIAQMMEDFRANSPQKMGGEQVVEMRDYQASESLDLRSGERKPIDLPKSNVVQFITDQGSKITARPSGTEPKIKFYISVRTNLERSQDFPEKKRFLESKLEAFARDLGLS